MSARRFGAQAALFALAALALPCVAGPALGAEGLWMASNGETRIRTERCGAKLCGRVQWLAQPIDPETGKPKLDVRNPDPTLRSRPVIGLRLFELTRARSGEWVGTIYSTRHGGTFPVTISEKPEGLQVRGCGLGGMVCQTQVWTR